MIKLFQQKSNRKFDEYLLAKKKSLSPEIVATAKNLGYDIPPYKDYPTLGDVMTAVLKAESNVWAAAADLLRKEELNQK
jgi:hypothetical protein